MAEISIVLCILIGVYGIGSWIDINGLWVQTPLLVQSAPEQWNLPSYMIIIIQIANIGPLSYLLINRITKKQISERHAIYVILLVGSLSCFLLSVFWRHTVYFLGQQRSVPLLVLTLLLALVDCTSSLVFLPYLAIYPSAYVTALYVGEGCSGLIPGIVALIQGVGGEIKCVNVTDLNGTSYIHPVHPTPKFPVRDFFIFLGIMLLTSFSAFTIVDKHPKFRNYRRKPSQGVTNVEYEGVELCGAPVKYEPECHSQKSVILKKEKQRDEVYSRSECILLLLLVTWINGITNGFLPSLQSYASLPYGNVPYHLSVTLSNIINPLACFLTFFWTVKALKWIVFSTAIGTAVAGYVTYLAFSSPNPPLVDNVGGKIIMITTSVLFVAIFSYSKTVIGLMLQKNGKKYLTLCGFFTQFGSLIGAIISFLLVNIFQLFTQSHLC